jgi:excisionase family DNA binding protein
MLSLIAFVAGIIMLIKGPFRLLNRTVSKRDARVAGAILMLPFIAELLIVLTLSFSLVSESMVVDAEGGVSISSQVFETYLNQVNELSMVFLASLVMAVLAAGYVIWRSPQANTPPVSLSNPSPAPPPAPPPPPTPQSRPSRPPREHPLGGFGVFAPAAAPKPVAPKSIMSVAEAAAYIGATPADVERLIDENRLPAARSNGIYAIARSALDDYVQGTL